MKNYVRPILNVGFYLCLMSLLMQCQKDELTTEVISTEKVEDQIDVSFLVTIVDESGQLVEGARLIVDDLSGVFFADEYGVVVLRNLKLKDLGTKVTIDKVGYFTQIKMLTGRSGSTKIKEIVLIKMDDGVLGNAGDLVNIDGEGQLQLPTVLIDQNGADYTGAVKILSHYFDPDDNDMLQEAPGNMIGINEENEYSILGTFGMYLIELSDPVSGEKLNLKSEQKAAIYFPIAETQKESAHESVPLWSFDEDAGIWKHEGDAVLANGMFVAEVSHFSFWNCDLPYQFVPFCATFVDDAQNPIIGLEIDFKVNNQRFGNDITDDEGKICGKVPTGKIISIHYSFDGITYYSLEIGPYESGALSEIIVLEGPVLIYGIAVDCDMNPISNGYGIWLTDDEFIPVLVQSDGSFEYWKVGFEHTLRLVDLSSNTFVDLEMAVVVEDLDLGVVAVCNEIMESIISGTAMLDNDEDGIGDMPVPSATVEVKNIVTNNIDYTTTTASDGTYSIFVLPNIEYELSIVSPSGMKTIYHGDMTPEDNDDKENWTDKTRQGFLAVISEATEVDADNDFQMVNDEVGTVSGIAMIDTDGDFIGDEPKSNLWLRVISYTQGTEEFINVYTDDTGKFSFETNNFIGIIRSIQNSVIDFDESPDPDGDDSEEGANSIIPIRLKGGEVDKDNNFVVNNLGSICGSVMEDTDNDEVGDTPVEGITITMLIGVGFILETTVTDQDGKYCFLDLAAGEYTVIEQNEAELDADMVDVYDGDETPEDADDAVDALNDDKIEVTLEDGENDADNNFVEEQLGSISGEIGLDVDNNGTGDTPQDGIMVSLTDIDNGTIVTTISDENGGYVFDDLETGSFVISITTPMGIQNVSDQDEEPDGDSQDSDTLVDSFIGVFLIPGEDDGGNNFVLRNE